MEEAAFTNSVPNSAPARFIEARNYTAVSYSQCGKHLWKTDRRFAQEVRKGSPEDVAGHWRDGSWSRESGIRDSTDRLEELFS
jgi:hypothetical protein